MAYFDLYNRLTTDKRFYNKVIGIQQRLIDMEAQEAAGKPVTTAAKGRQVQDLIQSCGYNPALLIPYLFPGYLGVDEHNKPNPLSLTNRPFTVALMHLQFGGYTVIRGSRQGGKTVTLGARKRTLCHVFPRFRSLYIAPRMEQMKTFATKYQEIHRGFGFRDHHPNYRKNLQLHEYTNGSVSELARIQTNADDIRGKSFDQVIYDEAQHFDPQFFPEVDQVLRASKMKITLFAGTSLTTETALEGRYQLSSKGAWMVRLPGGKWLDTSDAESCFSVIKPQGPTCPITGRLINMRNGMWVHADRKALSAQLVGFHVPQIIIPDFVEDPLEWATLYKQYREYHGGPKFIQEVLGIPTEEGDRELTEFDLQRMCILQENQAAQYTKAKRGHYKVIISGCDWGGSDSIPEWRLRESNTVHAIIGITQQGVAEVLHLKRYPGMGYHATAQDIVKNHLAWGATAIAVDAGVGDAYIVELLKSPIPAQSLVIFRYNSNMIDFLTATGEQHRQLNRFNLNRNEALTTVFQAIKRSDEFGGPRIQCRNYEEMESYLKECLNLYRAPYEDVASGRQRFLYRKHGTRPDDVLHAITFAYTLARIFMGESLAKEIRDQEALHAVFSRVRGPAPSPYGGGGHYSG